MTRVELMARTNLGPVSLDICDIKTILDKIEEFIVSRTPSQVVTLNSLMFNIALRDAPLRRVISEAALIIPESSGIIWATRFLNIPLATRVPGIDLLSRICEVCSTRCSGIFLLGAEPGVAETAASNLLKLYPGLKICGTHNGYFEVSEEEGITKLIAESAPDILFVGLEMPKQEFWIARNLTKLNVPVVMGVGGSFDVISGRLKRAPMLFRRLHLEWFFRFLQQPWRIKRLADLPAFVISILRIRLGSL